MNINREFISTNNINGTNNTCKYIVIHETANYSKGAGARAHAKAQFNGDLKSMSVHYYCGSDGVYQAAEHFCQCWHIGREYGGNHTILDATNNNTIGIEICVNEDGNYSVARNNAIELVRTLLKDTGISWDYVIRHFDAKGKYCPRRMMDDPLLWEDFKTRIKEEPKKDQWISKEGRWWYQHKDGSFTKNNWEKIDNKWYFFDEQGRRKDATWQFWKNLWYYLKDNGIMAENEWVKYKGIWYYLKAGGAMAELEWVKYKEKWYYLKKGGKMAAAEVLIIKNKKYSFAADGHLEYTDKNGALS